MLVVVALGGNALLRRGQSADATAQEANIRRAVRSIATLARHHRVVVTHGNGPQVGLLALESEQDPSLAQPYPLDVLGAETEGMIGYWLQRELINELPNREVVTILTQTLVDPDDPAFATPTKFIGQVYDGHQARSLAESRGWTVARDGKYWRRVVPSPAPRGFIETRVIQQLVDTGVVVVCAGGGGIPVVSDQNGLSGIEAVVDKDRAAALLGVELGADALLLLTDVAAIETDYGTPSAQPLNAVSVEHLRSLDLAAGSMGPKAEAACTFVEATGKLAAIGSLDDAEAMMERAAGTVIYPSRIATVSEAFTALS